MNGSRSFWLSLIFAGTVWLVPLASAGTPDLSTPEQIAGQIPAGMAHLDVSHVIDRARPGSGWPDATQLGRHSARSRYVLDDETCLVVTYEHVANEQGNLGPDDRVSAVRVTHFAALLKEIPAPTRELLRSIHHAPSISGYSFDPSPLIGAVNALQPLGKGRALQLLRSYDAICIAAKDDIAFDNNLDAQRIFLIARVLFSPADPSTSRPALHLGATDPAIKSGDPDWPEFPLALQDDVPFCLSPGYTLAGEAERPEEYLKEIEANEVIRAASLKPSAAPARAIELLAQSPRWRRLFKGPAEASFTLYLLRLQVMRSAIPMVLKLDDDNFICTDCQGIEQADQNWAAYVAKHRLMDGTWDASRQIFRGVDSGLGAATRP